MPSASAEAFVQRVATMPLPGRLLSTIASLLAIMHHLSAQLAYSDQAIEELAVHDARVQRLRPLPSIGPVTAAFVATLDDVRRFRHAHQVKAYLQASSDGNDTGPPAPSVARPSRPRKRG